MPVRPDHPPDDARPHICTSTDLVNIPACPYPVPELALKDRECWPFALPWSRRGLYELRPSFDEDYRSAIEELVR